MGKVNQAIEIKHHGAVRGVTGSCHELKVHGAGILIDCGLFQGSDYRADLSIEFDIAHIRALVVTHVHIDHVGRIPYLLIAGFTGPIYCSEPSALLLPAMLEDALKIGFTRNQQVIDKVLAQLTSQICALPYNQWQTTPHTDIKIRLQRAGHILGSAYVECEADGQRLVFSGDLGAPHSPLLIAPTPPTRCDVLILESTYGDQDHESRVDRRLRLKAVIDHALADGGTLLIPAFSLGRTQDLLYEIESLVAEFGQHCAAPNVAWRELEIVVDSPLAANFTSLYRKLKPFWNNEAQARLEAGRHPLAFEQLTVVDSHQDHLHAVQYLARTRKPFVVLAGSGMCTGGRVVNYLKALLNDARNDILFVGYQAQSTPGRAILEQGPKFGEPPPEVAGQVELDGVWYEVHAQVHQVSGYSAHAGQSDLINFALGCDPPPKEIRLVHGESAAKRALKKRLEGVLAETKVVIP